MSDNNELKISIVIPVYNSQSTIGLLVDKLIRVLDGYDIEIILVNDFSQDESHRICMEKYEEYSNLIQYLKLSKNFGEHNAVMAGLNYSKGDYAVIMDDDFQNPPEEVRRIVNEASNRQYDVIYTYYKKKQHHFMRNLGSWFNNKVANYLLDKPKDLYLSSFKCLSRFTIQEIIKYKGPFPFIDGLVLRCTSNIGRIEVKHDYRTEGRSGYTFKKLLRLWLNMFVNFSVIPLRASTFLGFTFSTLGVFLSIIVVIWKLLEPGMQAGWASMMIIVMMFSGIQLVILGLLGEYIGRLFLNNNETPQFVVRDFLKEK